MRAVIFDKKTTVARKGKEINETYNFKIISPVKV